MRFMTMHKVTPELEKGLPPDPESLGAIGALMEEAAKSGIFVGGDGLRPTSERLHIRYANGERTITRGPFEDAKELIAGFVELRVRSEEEALAWIDKLAAVRGDAELFVGPAVELWHLGFAPKPDDAPIRYLAMHQMNESAERELPPDPKTVAKIGALMAEMVQAGVLQSQGALASTKRGARLRFAGGTRTVIDGPFTESKELISGYSLLELPSMDEAITWATRFAEVVKVNEIDVRAMLDG